MGAMPRISAATVAEHRAAQRAAILAAGEAIIRESGAAAVTPRAVGERAGLARSSFYEYFPSRDDLLAAIALEAFEAWAEEIGAAMSAAARGRPRLHAYVEATMRMAADGKHELATELQQIEISPASLETIMAMHERLIAPLRSALEEAGVADIARQGELVQGLITAGLHIVRRGTPADEVSASIVAVLDGGVR